MCCKGKKCFGEQTLMVARVNGTIRLLSLSGIIGRKGDTVEFMTKTGHWTKLINAEFVGLDKVVQLPQWPLYLTPDHEFDDGTKAGDHGKPQKDKQLIYTLTLDEENVMAGPFFVKV